MLCGGAVSQLLLCMSRRTGLNVLFCFIDWPQADAFSRIRGVCYARWGLGQSGTLSIHIGACLGYIDVVIHQITRIMASKYGHKHVKALHTNVAMYVLTPQIIYEMLTITILPEDRLQNSYRALTSSSSTSLRRTPRKTAKLYNVPSTSWLQDKATSTSSPLSHRRSDTLSPTLLSACWHGSTRSWSSGQMRMNGKTTKVRLI